MLNNNNNKQENMWQWPNIQVGDFHCNLSCQEVLPLAMVAKIVLAWSTEMWYFLVLWTISLQKLAPQKDLWSTFSELY